MLRLAVSIGTLEIGGAETFVINLLKNIDYARISVLLLVLGRRTGSSLEKEADRLPIEVRYISKKEGFSPRAVLRIWQALKEFKPDILHGNIGGLIYFLPFLYFHKIKAIYTAHTLPEREFGFLKRFFIKKLIKNGKIIPVGISPEIKESLEKIYEIKKIPMIANGIEVEKFKHKRSFRSEMVLGSVGRFEPVKNHRTIINVFLTLKASFPKLKLRLVGGGSLFDKYKNSYQEREDIVFVGMSEHVPEELKKIDIFFIPSFYEGLPLAVLEAMASGCVIVGSNVGGLRGLVENGINGYLLQDCTDVEGFSNLIAGLLQDPELLEMISLNNTRKAENYNLKETAQKYQELYISEAGNVKRRI